MFLIDYATLATLASATFCMAERNLANAHNAKLDPATRHACLRAAYRQTRAYEDIDALLAKAL